MHAVSIQAVQDSESVFKTDSTSSYSGRVTELTVRIVRLEAHYHDTAMTAPKARILTLASSYNLSVVAEEK
jgi:hypothetical protein